MIEVSNAPYVGKNDTWVQHHREILSRKGITDINKLTLYLSDLGWNKELESEKLYRDVGVWSGYVAAVAYRYFPIIDSSNKNWPLYIMACAHVLDDAYWAIGGFALEMELGCNEASHHRNLSALQAKPFFADWRPIAEITVSIMRLCGRHRLTCDWSIDQLSFHQRVFLKFKQHDVMLVQYAVRLPITTLIYAPWPSSPAQDVLEVLDLGAIDATWTVETEA